MATIKMCNALMPQSFRRCCLPLGHNYYHVADDGWEWTTDQQILWAAAHGHKGAQEYCRHYGVRIPAKATESSTNQAGAE